MTTKRSNSYILIVYQKNSVSNRQINEDKKTRIPRGHHRKRNVVQCKHPFNFEAEHPIQVWSWHSPTYCVTCSEIKSPWLGPHVMLPVAACCLLLQSQTGASPLPRLGTIASSSVTGHSPHTCCSLKLVFPQSQNWAPIFFQSMLYFSFETFISMCDSTFV